MCGAPSASSVDNQKVWWPGPPVPGASVSLPSRLTRTSSRSRGASPYSSAKFLAVTSWSLMSVHTVLQGDHHLAYVYPRTRIHPREGPPPCDTLRRPPARGRRLLEHPGRTTASRQLKNRPTPTAPTSRAPRSHDCVTPTQEPTDAHGPHFSSTQVARLRHTNSRTDRRPRPPISRAPRSHDCVTPTQEQRAPPDGSAGLEAGAALGGLDRVAEQHGDGGGADAADPRGDRAGDLLAALVDVGQQLAALVADAAADHDHARA